MQIVKHMKTDYIAEIGIDEMQRLYICPAHETFPHIYRAAMEVNWDEKRKCLRSPKPREWSYVQWYVQIVDAARDEYGIKLSLSPDTRWVNIAQDLTEAILQTKGKNA